MIKRNYATAAAIIIMVHLLITANISCADDGWEMKIVVIAMSAENKLSIGQRPDASDGTDGKYDIPALLSGDIKAYMELGGSKYWRDIKQTCSIKDASCKKTWNVVVDSMVRGEPIKLRWNASAIPQDLSIFLIDITTGKTIDMKAGQEYSYDNTETRKFKIEAQSYQ